MADVELRKAVGSDDRALAVLDAESWPPELWVIPPRPATEPFFTDWRRPEDVLVAVSGSEVLGYARIGRHMRVESNRHVLHFEALAVAPSARNRGVGNLLVAGLIDEAQRRGARKLGLRALSTNDRAIRLYEKHGFTLEGRLREEIRLPDGSYVDDLWFSLFFDQPDPPASLGTG
jgi:ribosomal protein S18 acetylase RimI-like enzyme